MAVTVTPTNKAMSGHVGTAASHADEPHGAEWQQAVVLGDAEAAHPAVAALVHIERGLLVRVEKAPLRRTEQPSRSAVGVRDCRCSERLLAILASSIDASAAGGGGWPHVNSQ
jgi:hypothetical protein